MISNMARANFNTKIETYMWAHSNRAAKKERGLIILVKAQFLREPGTKI